ncbi:MAG: hypothetical protein ACI8RZ_003512 [Myxococcota bacterium]
MSAEELVDGEDTLKLDFPLANGDGLSTSLSSLEDTAFDDGVGMTWLLSRSGALAEDSGSGE